MSANQIREWVQILERTLGEPRPLIDPEPLKLLHNEKKFPEMVTHVRKTLGLDLRLSVGLVNSGGPENTPAWVNIPRPMPIYGTRAFRELRLTTYFRKDFLNNAPFGTVVMSMSHELSHIVLDSLNHDLRGEEKVVDLTAMLLGYRKLFLHHTEVKTTRVCGGVREEGIVHYGYLSLEEIRYAVTLMRS